MTSDYLPSNLITILERFWVEGDSSATMNLKGKSVNPITLVRGTHPNVNDREASILLLLKIPADQGLMRHAWI